MSCLSVCTAKSPESLDGVASLSTATHHLCFGCSGCSGLAAPHLLASSNLSLALVPLTRSLTISLPLRHHLWYSSILPPTRLVSGAFPSLCAISPFGASFVLHFIRFGCSPFSFAHHRIFLALSFVCIVVVRLQLLGPPFSQHSRPALLYLSFRHRRLPIVVTLTLQPSRLVHR